MKTLITISRIIVGLLFIFSGLIKANDPLGLAYKMEEFFEIWNMGLAGGGSFNNLLIGLFDFLHQYSLVLSVLMIAFEIIAGAALLLGWRMKLFIWLLLLLTVFFTFLTGYAYLSGKFKNCGCFGDCIPIKPFTSFMKDVVLTILIVLLFFGRKWIQPIFNRRITIGTMVLVTIFSFGVQWYTLNYLPVFDCLSYKKGKNIPEQMKMPADAVPSTTVITFVYDKQGQEVEFTADKLPVDIGDTAIYKYKDRRDKVIDPGKNNEPPIKGFVLTTSSGVDSTVEVLSQPYALLFYFIDHSTKESKWKSDFIKLHDIAVSKGIPVYVITGRMTETQNIFNDPAFKSVQLFNCDNVAIKTAARTNPCIYLLKEGTIEGKWSYRSANKANRTLTSLVVPQRPMQEQKPLPVDSVPAPIDNSKIK
jgi:uncharacterized membrane protein YphA (DoxX/SURF4 family)